MSIVLQTVLIVVAAALSPESPRNFIPPADKETPSHQRNRRSVYSAAWRCLTYSNLEAFGFWPLFKSLSLYYLPLTEGSSF